MNVEERKGMQVRVGLNGDDVDGDIGPISIKAIQKHLKDLMPKPNPWPKSDQTSLRKFYGNPGDESNLVSITFPYPMYYGGKLVKTTRVHKKCAESLVRILNAIKDKYISSRPDVAEEAQDYGGIYNFRMKRGGSTYSLHAFGAAIDLDADDNAFKDHWPLTADMPLEVMEEFAKEGWLPAGPFWGYDSMHFQATQ